MTRSAFFNQPLMLSPGVNTDPIHYFPNFRQYRLSFGDFELLDDCLLTMRVDRGVEFNGRMAQQTLDLCARLFNQPGGLLIDHFHDYSYAFDALHLFAEQSSLPCIGAKAILVHNLRDHQSAKYLLAMGNDRRRSEFGIFNSRTEAISWLREGLSRPLPIEGRPRSGLTNSR